MKSLQVLLVAAVLIIQVLILVLLFRKNKTILRLARPRPNTQDSTENYYFDSQEEFYWDSPQCFVFIYSQNYRRQPVSQSNYVRDTPQVPRSPGVCPEKNGRYPTSTCDGYIECNEGVPEEKVCPDGLLFNAAAGVFAFPCQYPIDVDCSGREQTHPAQATDECPHQFGYYRMGDDANCGKFKNCVDGKAYVFDCPEGLAFNGETYRCDWADQVSTCNVEAFLGFSCPPDARSLGLGLGQEEYRFFRSPHDCQHYYLCLEGKPRIYNCGEGRAFNDIINSCDGAENVTGCAVPTNNYNKQFDTKRKPEYNTNFRASGR